MCYLFPPPPPLTRKSKFQIERFEKIEDLKVRSPLWDVLESNIIFTDECHSPISLESRIMHSPNLTPPATCNGMLY